jgi:uncharacterized protein YdeI (YjbR/CyaY-like superfamily)
MFMQILHFKSSAAFRRWLAKNHDKPEGLWLRFFKKHSGEKSLTYAEALDQALCYGWIDSQAKPFDEISWLQKYTPDVPKADGQSATPSMSNASPKPGS